MSLPLLIVGGRQEYARGPDLLLVEPEKDSIGIQKVRALQKFLQRKPYSSPIKTAVITQAEKLTLPAQNALLKTLEEPPDNSQIILLCPAESELLPTVVSRCFIKRLPEAKSLAERLEKPTEAAAANSQTAREFVTGQLYLLHRELHRHPQKTNVKLISALNLALSALKANVNPKLTLDVLALSY